MTSLLKTALDSKQRDIKTLENNSLEANNDLDEKVKAYKDHTISFKKQFL